MIFHWGELLEVGVLLAQGAHDHVGTDAGVDGDVAVWISDFSIRWVVRNGDADLLAGGSDGLGGVNWRERGKYIDDIKTDECGNCQCAREYKEFT